MGGGGRKRRVTGGGARARGYQPRTPPRPKRERAMQVVERLRRRYPDARCALDHRNAFELLVSTILSAQCTDERVNQVTPDLFHRWPTPAALARADRAEVEDVVRSTGFFRNKAKNVQGMAARLVEEHGGRVPRDMEALTALPGVARKTANVVRGVVWNLADGVVVDTHVLRLARRLGWTRRTSPVHVERDLMALFDRRVWVEVSHLLIHHGRAICKARRPDCAACPVHELCPSSTVA
jgi:endonuclease III